MERMMVNVDGCQACAHVLHATNEIITIYPITPSSPIAEHCDAKTAAGSRNIWGTIPVITQMQSEAGVAGSVHGSLTTGALTSTVTASQGLLLMIPDMYKIAGELTPTVFHVAARTIAAQALSIFGDHQDVMAARATGFAMLCSRDVQEVMDFALIAQAATLEARVPFLHFFDGFRTSHEIKKIEQLTFDDMRHMINDDLVRAHRKRGLTPDRPSLRGTAQNPDVYFQGRETVNRFYLATPQIVQNTMNKFAELTGRSYKLFQYYGHPEADRVAVVMGSAGETLMGTIDALNRSGQKLGLVQVRLYRPFDTQAFIEALPSTAKSIAVLDRTKEPGSTGEPLYLDVRAALDEARQNGLARFQEIPSVFGGRYGLASKEFSPPMAKAVFDNLSSDTPKNHFTVGILDDVTNTSLLFDKSFDIEGDKYFRALFYGLGADGTVSANKSSIKIVGSETDNWTQAYFVYDSRKSGAVTISHLRFGKDTIASPYLVNKADFVACHNSAFLYRLDMADHAKDGAVFLLTTSWKKDEVWERLPVEVQEQLIARKMKLYIIDAVSLAEEIGLEQRINIIMQTAFFVISGIIPKEHAVRAIKQQVEKTYRSKGQNVLKMNYEAVDRALQNIVEIPVPEAVKGNTHRRPPLVGHPPEFIEKVAGTIFAGKGDELPVSAMPFDGTWPTEITRYEKRNFAVHIPMWEPSVCIQCGLCSFVCPHATIRIKAYDPSLLENAPAGFRAIDAVGKDLKGLKFTVQVAPEDCTGCRSCVFTCPAFAKDEKGNKIPDFKAINMLPKDPNMEEQIRNYDFFLSLPETDPARYNVATVKGSQFRKSLFEYHTACNGCGETPYIRLLTQLFGDRLLIANATGCSSIYGGNLPDLPYAKRADGKGPAWSNSLFEDNAEFAFGMLQTINLFYEEARRLLQKFFDNDAYTDSRNMIGCIINADQSTQEQIEGLRGSVEDLKRRLASDKSEEARRLLSLADYLVKKSVWAVGGDGWAYDIGFGGLDHVLSSGRNIKMLVLDSEVYSNTGGQMSKATPLSAQAKFAEAGKRTPKKSLGVMMTTYGNIYVAQVAFGANPAQTVKAFTEAEAYEGPALIVAYSTCIAQGIDMGEGVQEQRNAVACGHWPLYRYNPDLEKEGKPPLIIDSKEPSISFEEYAGRENRFRALRLSNPTLADILQREAQANTIRRWKYLKHLAAWKHEK